MKMSSSTVMGKFCLWGVLLFALIKGYAGKDVIVIIVDYNGPIHKINATDGTSSLLYRDNRGPENIAYDPLLEHVYWSNLETDRIQRINLDGSGRTRVINVNQCQGMVVDPVSRLLFYGDDTTKVISKMNLKTQETTVIARTSSPNRPHDITADTDRQMLYWTVLGSSPQIESSDYNGNKRTSLLRGGLVPTALALDSTGRTLFWCDEHASRNELMAINLDTRETSTVPYGSLGNLYDLDIVDTTLYMIDRTKRSVYLSMPERGGTPKAASIPSGMNQFRHIKAFAYPYDCPNGKYGEGCNATCGHCLHGNPCARMTGHCPAGCQPGWKTSNCNEVCEDGTYGAGCGYKCGQCRDSNTCSKTNGQCPNGCDAGWTGAQCHQECQDGFYGSMCNIPCGQCADGQTCDNTDGQCGTGCQPGWTGATCHGECRDGVYGVNCSSSCGQCKNQTACNKSNGHCSEGCESGWGGVTCKDGEKEGRSNVAAIVASVFVVAVVAAIVGMLGVVYYLRRRQSTGSKPSGHGRNQTDVVYSAMRDQTDFDESQHSR